MKARDVNGEAQNGLMATTSQLHQQTTWYSFVFEDHLETDALCVPALGEEILHSCFVT